MFNFPFALMLAFVPISLLALGTEAEVNAYNIITVDGATNKRHPNDAPIIGVLAQEMSYHLNAKWPGVFSSYIAASYIKFIEGGGARAVPIWIGKPKEYYEDILGKVNGVLFPGGATWFNATNGYSEAGRHIYDIAQHMNDNKQHMPLFGTCLGFELFLYLSANNKEYRGGCDSQRRSLPLNFTDEFKNSQMFGTAPADVIQILNNEYVTPNFHQFCTTRQNVTDFQFDKQWKILSWNNDINGVEFVSTIEHKLYPFYGTQFHPEKAIYEWIRNRGISHTANAIKAAQWFATFYVEQARQSLNKFTDINEENRVLIYNYQPTFTGLVKSAFEQSYLFKSDVDYVRPDDKPNNGNNRLSYSIGNSTSDTEIAV